MEIHTCGVLLSRTAGCLMTNGQCGLLDGLGSVLTLPMAQNERASGVDSQIQQRIRSVAH